MQYRSQGLAAIVGAVALATGCAASPSEVACTAEGRPSLVLIVDDSSTHATALPGSDIRVQNLLFAYWRDVPDTVSSPNDSLLVPAPRAETYDVTVTRTGYRPWENGDVTLTADECGIKPLFLHVNLVPQ
jgi:hypothetical protein